MTHDTMSQHPNLEQYYDRATDRTAVGAHLAGCTACRAWLVDVHERLGHLACVEFVELVTEYTDDSVDDGLRARIQDHVRMCEGCRNYLDQMRSTVATIGRIGQPSESSEPSALVRVALIATFRAWRRATPGVRHDH